MMQAKVNKLGSADTPQLRARAVMPMAWMIPSTTVP